MAIVECGKWCKLAESKTVDSEVSYKIGGIKSRKRFMSVISPMGVGHTTCTKSDMNEKPLQF